MSDDIPFDQSFDLPPDTVEEVMPGVRRILCNNPGPFTFKGTVSYIVGPGRVAIIDPGPVDERAYRGAARCRARRDGDAHRRHPHPPRPFARCGRDQGGDRGDDVRRRSASRRAAAQYRRGAAAGIRRRSRPSTPTRGCATATWSSGPGWALEAIATPGHCANHMAFALKGTDVLVLRRPRDGLVDAGGGAARRLDERLHGVARKARAP